MLLVPIPRSRDHAIASPPDAASPSIMGHVFYGVVAMAGSAAAWAMTGKAWIAAVVAVGGLTVCGWRVAAAVSALHAILTSLKRENCALEESLRRAQSIEAVGRVAVDIAHDFNNQLTVISSNLELVKRRLDGGNERLHRHADAALHGVQRAAALTLRLLSLSRQSAPEPEPIDVRRVLGSLSDLLRRTLGEGVTLTVEDSGETWYVWVDVNQMEQAILSMAVSVRDKMLDTGALVVSVSNVQLDKNPTAADPAVLPGDYVCIAVGTTPEPLGSDLLPRPVGAYQPGSDVSIARAFLREAGAYVLRAHRPGTSDGFRLFLPRHAPPAGAPSAPSRRRAEHRGARPIILIVEDDAAVREASVQALQSRDYEILQAPDAMEGFRLIADNSGIDLLVTDLGLPGGVSGRALADAARNLDPSMSVVFITGYDRVDLSGHAGSSVLNKPFSPTQLADCVAEALAARHTAGAGTERLRA